jgi:hypothetical protein
MSNTHAAIVNALAANWRGAQWMLGGDDLSTLVWLDTVTPRPADDQLNAAIAALPVSPVPALISDRQFFQQLAVQGVITQDEALAAVKTGSIPAALQTLINGLPADQQFAATMLIAGATAFERYHPLTTAIGQAYGWSADQIDALFRAAAVL